MTILEKKLDILSRDKRHLVSGASYPVVKKNGDDYGYEAALTAAGCKVLAFKEFGSYQGAWWAYLLFPNEEKYFVGGSFGSCSSCDAFKAEFGYADCRKKDYPSRLREFGLRYLENCSTKEQALAEAGENISWDLDAQEAVNWIKAQGE